MTYLDLTETNEIESLAVSFMIFPIIIGDKLGRIKVLFGSIFLYSVANFVNGMVHDVDSYAIVRFVAGIGLAGELGAGIAKSLNPVLEKMIRQDIMNFKEYIETKHNSSSQFNGNPGSENRNDNPNILRTEAESVEDGNSGSSMGGNMPNQ